MSPDLLPDLFEVQIGLATFRHKSEVFGVVVNSAGQSKARRGDRGLKIRWWTGAC